MSANPQQPGHVTVQGVTFEPPPPDAREAGVVDLPSRGVFYGDKCPDGKVELYAMTGKDEALVHGLDETNITEVVDELMHRCLKTRLDPDEMLSTDKFYLSLVLRANNYGEEYECPTRCPICGNIAPRLVKVPTDFKITYYDREDREPFETTLSKTGKKVTFRLLRGADEREILTYRRRESEKRQSIEDPAYVYAMTRQILTVDGKPFSNITERLTWFEKLPASDASDFAAAVEDHTSGVQTAVEVTCRNVACKTMFRVGLAFTAGFFRTRRRGV